MNTGIAITPETAEVHTLDFTSNTKTVHRKIAKLPKPLRDLINDSLDDGLPARQIIEKLQASINPPLPYPISEVNISDWRKTGYQHYLNQQERLARIQSNHEAALEMVSANDTMTLPEAGLQIIASQYFEFLGDLSPAALKEKLVEDPLKYTRFLNVFARLVREIVHLRKHRDKMLAQTNATRAAKSGEKDHSPLVAEVDKIFRIPRPHTSAHNSNPAPAPLPSSAAPNPLNTKSSPSPSSPLSSKLLSSSSSSSASIENQNGGTSLASKFETCLDCGSPLPPVPSNASRRPEDHCPSCGMLLPDIGLCYQPGSDHCLNCGATQPALLPQGERPRPNCHNCGIRLHNPETTPHEL